MIYCIGDSHVAFFSGTDVMQPKYPLQSDDRLTYFRTFRLGAVLAYNLCRTGTQSQGREKLFQVLNNGVPDGAYVLLTFGEIDCRVHLLKQSEKQKRSIVEIVSECVTRYFSVVREVSALGYQVILWNVVASNNSEIDNPEYPKYGTCYQRNYVTSLFNSQLSVLCAEYKFPFVSIFDDLVDEQLITKVEYYRDYVHLSQQAMPLAVAALTDVLPDVDFSSYEERSVLSNTVSTDATNSWTTLKESIPNMPFWDAWRNQNKKNTSSERKLSPLLDVGFHGDTYLLECVASFIPHLTHFVETGANVGTTTRYMAATYSEMIVYSCEPDKKAYEKALEATAPYRTRVTLYNELSPQFLHTLYMEYPVLREHINLYWLDAHSYGYRWPLHDELQFITQQNEAGIIMVDDSQIPNQPQFTFSAYDNQVCDSNYIRNGLSEGKRYQLIYPTYTEHTSPHHPLVGVTTIIFGATLMDKITINEHFTSEILVK